jgi:CYTH domain-containing protein
LAIEIERRFLVRDAGIVRGVRGTDIEQGYIARSDALTVRVRIATPDAAAPSGAGASRDAATSPAGAAAATLSIKSRGRGIVRHEFEDPLPVDDARALLALADLGHVAKTRYRLPVGNVVYEVDVFTGANAPLVLGEVELPAAGATFPRPDWLGAEVSGDVRCANESLARLPFSRWPAGAPGGV